MNVAQTGELIARLRTSMGMTQAQLAQRLAELVPTLL